MRVTLRELLTNIYHFYFKSTFFEAELGEHFSIAWYFLPQFDHNSIVFAFCLYHDFELIEETDFTIDKVNAYLNKKLSLTSYEQ